VESGPYAWSTIEQMLAELQIGLHHEIEHEGRWMTIRDFIARTKVQSAPLPQTGVPTASPGTAPPPSVLPASQAPPAQQVRRFKLPSFKSNRKP
jgi:hypothetical protein